MWRFSPVLPGLFLLALAGQVATGDEVTYGVGHDKELMDVAFETNADHGEFVNVAFESETDLETIVGTTHQAAGEIKIDGPGQTGSVRLSVPVNSLCTGDDLRDEHLCSETWLDAETFPELTFASESVRKVEGTANKVEVLGDFTMHGVTRELTVVVEFKDVPDAAVQKAHFPPGRWIRFSTEFKVKLSDFGVEVPEMVIDKVNDSWTVKMVIFARATGPETK